MCNKLDMDEEEAGGRSILLAPFASAVATAFASPRTYSHHNVTHALTSIAQKCEEGRSQQLC